MKLFSLFASLLFAGALLFIFSSATTKPTVDGHKPVATFWPGAKVKNDTEWVMLVKITYVGFNEPKTASVAAHTTHTFDGSTNLISSVSARLNRSVDADNIINTKRWMYHDGNYIYKLTGLGCGTNCNFTLTQNIDKITPSSDTLYRATVTKD
jgi:hypothetical protein